jgi:hypothetical protein
MGIKPLVLSGFLLMQLTVFAQDDSIALNMEHDSTKMKYDSATNRLFNSANQLKTDIRRRNLNEYNEDIIATKQDEIIEKIRALTIEAKGYLENGLDTTGLAADLNKIEYWYHVTSDGVFTNTSGLQTHRNLETTYKIMDELLTRILKRKSALDDHYKNLLVLRNTIDSLYNQNVLYKFSSDSAVLMRYVKKLVVVDEEVKPVDSSFKTTLTIVSELQTTVNRFVNRLNASIAQIEIFQQQVSGKTFSREASNLGALLFIAGLFHRSLMSQYVKGYSHLSSNKERN